MKIEIQEKLGVERDFISMGIIVSPVGIVTADIDAQCCVYTE